MTRFHRSILPLVAAVAVVGGLATWAGVSAAQPAGQPAMMHTLHFQVVPTSQHFDGNGATRKNPAGSSFMESMKFVSGGHSIGWGRFVATIIGSKGNAIATIAASFNGLGQAELQGLFHPKGGNTFVLTGGTGVFAGASGAASGHARNVTFSYS